MTGDPAVDVSQYRSRWSWSQRIRRLLWGLVWTCAFRFSPRWCFAWRRALLRAFGASIGRGVHVYPSARIWAPWNLIMGDHSCLSFEVDCYSVATITIGAHATVSQYTFLCAAGHDITDPGMRLTTAPITIGTGAWIAARALIYPGVVIGDGAVVAAGAVVVKDVAAMMVVGGNPAQVLKQRIISPQPVHS